jgi:hypothetical protein
MPPRTQGVTLTLLCLPAAGVAVMAGPDSPPAPPKPQPTIAVTARYPGAGCQVVADTLAAPIEASGLAFDLHPGGRFLYAAGEASGRLAAYRIDQGIGTLERFATYRGGTQPWWLLSSGCRQYSGRWPSPPHPQTASRDVKPPHKGR